MKANIVQETKQKSRPDSEGPKVQPWGDPRSQCSQVLVTALVEKDQPKPNYILNESNRNKTGTHQNTGVAPFLDQN